MKTLFSILLGLTLACAGAAWSAQSRECNEHTEPDIVAVAITPAMTVARAEQAIYKGVVGNLLETVPLDPVTRVELQRTNAVISSPLTGRSLAMLLGVASPVLIIGGLIWGIWAASQIESVAPEVSDTPAPAPVVALTPGVLVALD